MCEKDRLNIFPISDNLRLRMKSSVIKILNPFLVWISNNFRFNFISFASPQKIKNNSIKLVNNTSTGSWKWCNYEIICERISDLIIVTLPNKVRSLLPHIPAHDSALTILELLLISTISLMGRSFLKATPRAEKECLIKSYPYLIRISWRRLSLFLALPFGKQHVFATLGLQPEW